jgi:hypothetical protein
MILTLNEKLSAAVIENASKRGVVPEALAIEFLRRKFLPTASAEDWDQRMDLIRVDREDVSPEGVLDREALCES